MAILNYTIRVIDTVPDEATVIDATELIGEWYSNCEFALNANMFNYHQQKDKEIQTQIKRRSKSIQIAPFIQPKRLKK